MINWFNHLYPYSNFHELNLDWVIATVKRGEQDISDFIGVNTIKYANPILWNIESQYEANTVVVDGQTGNAYISVKAVPSGVHLNRTEYWSQIYNYANEVDRIKSNLDNETTARTQADAQLQEYIDDEETARTNADTQLQTSIDNEVQARTQAVTNLQNQINSHHLPRRAILMGDSWATGFKSGVPGNYLASPWPNQVQTFFGLSNDDCYILRIDGASFTNTNPKLNFEHMLTEAAPTIENAATITDIVVCAGNNEMNKSTADIIAAIDSFAAYCRNIYPNAKVEIGMIGGGKCTDVVCYDNVTRSSVYCFYEYSLKGYERGANKNNNCRYLNGVQYACRQDVYSYFGYDNTDQHPDQAGQNQIATAIITALRNGIADVLGFTNSMSLTAGSNVSVVTSAPWYNRLINNIVSIGSHGVTELTFQNMTNYVCDGNHEIELFNIGGGSICGVSEGTQKYVLPCYMMDGDAAFHSGNITIWFDKQKVKATIISMGATGWLTKTLASLWIPKFAFEIDSMTC